ncbi:MAG: PAS domain-containing protein [Planctomycetes bacterium]|nr:PAS domain-containing protein [Planctomycetota bacterium]
MTTAALLRSDGLSAVDSALVHAASADEVAQRVAAAARVALDARLAFVWLLDARRTHLVLEGRAEATPFFTAEYLRRFSAIPLEADLPAAWSLRTGAPVWLRSRAEVLARYPAIAPALEATDLAIACVPVPAPGGPLGVLAVRLSGPHDFEADERGFLARLAAVAGRALERSGLQRALGPSDPHALRWEEDDDGCARLWSEGPVLGHPALVDPQPRAWWRERLHPDDAARTLASLEAFRSGGDEAWTERYRLRRADGDYVLVEDHARALRRDGAARRMVGALVERPSPGAAGDLRALLDDLPGAIAWERDAETLRLTYASQAATEVLGTRTPDAALRDPCWLEHVHVDDRARVASALRDHGRDGRGDLELRYRAWRSDGRQVRLRDRVRRVSEGPGRWLRGLTLDATALETLEEERARAARRVALLVEAGRALGGSLDRDETLGALARLVVPALADGCCVHLAEPGGLRLAAAVSEDPALLAAPHELERRWALGGSGATAVLRTGRADAANDLPGAVRAYLCVPLAARGRVLGVLSLLSRDGGLDAEVAGVAEELAARAGLALDNAALFRAQADERALLAAVLEQLPAGVVVVDPEGTLHAHNPEAERLCGRTFVPATAPGEYYRGLRAFTPDGRQLEAHEWPLARAVRGEAVALEELDFVGADGGRQPLRVRATPVRDEAGRQLAAVVVFTDEREAVARRRALEDTNRTLEALVRASPLATVLLDATATVWLWNPAAERMFGWSAGEVLGRPFPAADPAACGELGDALRHVLAGTALLELHTRGRHREGGALELCTWAAPVPGPGGEARCLALVADVSNARRMERELLAHAHALDDRDRRKDEFLALLGHELRNPIAAIIATTALLGAGDPLRAQQARAVLERQARHMARLVDDLLDAARLTRGAISLRLEPVPLAGAIDSALATVGPLLTAREHHVVRRARGAPVALADPVRLEQVLVNLLTNAARYTPPGGRIEVEARRRGDEAEVAVRDSGVGIAADLLPHVFDPFIRGDAGPGRHDGGLGLGLTVVRRLIELHGGRVEARSPGPGAGSELVFWLPLALVPEAAAPAPATAAPAAPRRVLIVDDNLDAGGALAIVLADAGHAVRSAADAEAALRALDEAPADVALLDIGLPGLDGYELARRIRARPADARMLLVAVTGYGGASHRTRALAAGFDHHLLKPVDMAALELLLAAPPR